MCKDPVKTITTNNSAPDIEKIVLNHALPLMKAQMYPHAKWDFLSPMYRTNSGLILTKDTYGHQQELNHGLLCKSSIIITVT